MNTKKRLATGLLFLVVILAGCQAGNGDAGENGGATPRQNPLPTLSSITPTAIVTHMPAFTMRVNGGDFVNGARVVFNGKEMDTTFVDSTTLSATVEPGSTAMSAAGEDGLSVPQAETVTVRVRNPSPGGGDSGSLDFIIHANFAFETPLPISDPGHDAYHGKINVTADGRVDAVWHEAWGSDNRRSRMRHSGDGGGSWGPIRTISAMAYSDNPALCRDGEDTLHCVFDYTANPPASVLRHTSSTDNGTTWSPPESIPSTMISRPLYPRLMAGTGTTIHLVYRCVQVFAIRSDNGGSSWGPRVQVSAKYHQPTGLDACRDEEGNLFTIWEQPQGRDVRKRCLWFSRSPDGGSSWLTPQEILSLEILDYKTHLSLAAGINQRLVAAWSLYNVTGYGDRFTVETRFANKLGNTWSARKRMHSESSDAGSSELCSDPGGNVHLFLTDDEVQRDAFRLRFRRSTDNGSTWSDAVFVRNVTRRYLDPSAACDAAGNVYVVFTDKLNGRNTVFFTRSLIP